MLVLSVPFWGVSPSPSGFPPLAGAFWFVVVLVVPTVVPAVVTTVVPVVVPAVVLAVVPAVVSVVLVFQVVPNHFGTRRDRYVKLMTDKAID